VPKIWEDTVEEHRAAVRGAAIDAAAKLIAANGLRSTTMASIASEAGIARATLYKYFSSADEILLAWHERHVAGHIRELHELTNADAPPSERLRQMLTSLARARRSAPPGEVSAALHSSEHVQRAEAHLHGLLAHLIREAVEEGSARSDIAAKELAEFAFAALSGGGAASLASLNRRVELVLDAISVR
jgi:AcrR family transcriptional regulator